MLGEEEEEKKGTATPVCHQNEIQRQNEHYLSSGVVLFPSYQSGS